MLRGAAWAGADFELAGFAEAARARLPADAERARLAALVVPERDFCVVAIPGRYPALLGQLSGAMRPLTYAAARAMCVAA